MNMTSARRQDPKVRAKINALALSSDFPAERAVAESMLALGAEDRTNALQLLAVARTALQDAHGVLEVKDVRDRASAIKTYVRARGIGVEAENEATVLIAEAERKIGQAIKDMRAEGRLVSAEGGSPVGWRHQREHRPRVDVETLGGLGIANAAARKYHLLAQLTDEEFAKRIALARVKQERIPKVFFLRDGPKPATPAEGNQAFVRFRGSVHGLLGWEIDEDMNGHATKNGLLELTNDELASVATLLQAMVVAYQQARVARA